MLFYFLLLPNAMKTDVKTKTFSVDVRKQISISKLGVKYAYVELSMKL